MSTPEQLLLAPGHREQSLAWAAGGQNILLMPEHLVIHPWHLQQISGFKFVIVFFHQEF